MCKLDQLYAGKKFVIDNKEKFLDKNRKRSLQDCWTITYKAVSSLFSELSDICYCTYTQSNIISLLLLLPGEGGRGDRDKLQTYLQTGWRGWGRERETEYTKLHGCPYTACQVLNDQLLPCVLVEAV